MSNILCSVATRGRYFTTLPLVLMAIANQTRLPDKLIIFDDNDEPKDMRNEFLYQHIFNILKEKNINWEWQFADKKGQHYIHQRANSLGYKWVWRVDDDCIPQPNTLEILYKHTVSTDSKPVGAVGGSILTPPIIDTSKVSGLINNIDSEPSIQWGYIQSPKEVEHLHCSFLYKANIHDYNLGLSRVAHREETLFTYGLHLKGYKILAVPNAISWHLKNPEGGIRSEKNAELYAHDEEIFRNVLKHRNKTIVVLDAGMGDHIVFSHILPEIKNAEVFTCYPDIVPGKPISEAYALFGNLDQFNIYGKMHQWGWKGSLEDAYRKLYL